MAKFNKLADFIACFLANNVALSFARMAVKTTPSTLYDVVLATLWQYDSAHSRVPDFFRVNPKTTNVDSKKRTHLGRGCLWAAGADPDDAIRISKAISAFPPPIKVEHRLLKLDGYVTDFIMKNRR